MSYTPDLSSLTSEEQSRMDMADATVQGSFTVKTSGGATPSFTSVTGEEAATLVIADTRTVSVTRNTAWDWRDGKELALLASLSSAVANVKLRLGFVDAGFTDGDTFTYGMVWEISSAGVTGRSNTGGGIVSSSKSTPVLTTGLVRFSSNPTVEGGLLIGDLFVSGFPALLGLFLTTETLNQPLYPLIEVENNSGASVTLRLGPVASIMRNEHE